MNSSGVGASNVDVWQVALDSLQSPALRPEFSLEEVPAPQRLAPHSIALAVEAVDADDARGFIERDPYFSAGFWESIEIFEFIPAAGDWIGGKIW